MNQLADAFANTHKLDKNLTKQLYLDIFRHSLCDIDLPLVPYMLEKVEDKLSTLINKDSPLNQTNYGTVLQNWQDLCSSDDDIHPFIKAPIESIKQESLKEPINSIKNVFDL